MKRSTKKVFSIFLALLMLCPMLVVSVQQSAPVSAANTFLGNLNIDVARPTVGANPEAATVNYEHRNEITMDTSWWVDEDTSASMSDTDTFTAGKTYRIYVKIKTQTGYQFNKDTVVYIAGKKAELTTREAYNITAMVKWKLDTFSMDIYSLQLPGIGEKLADTPVEFNYDTDLTVTRAEGSWGTYSSYDDVFTSGQSYYANLTFTFEEELPDHNHITVTYNETADDNITVYADADEHGVYILYAFTYKYVDVVDFLIPSAGDKAAIYKNTYDYETNLNIQSANLVWYIGNGYTEVTTFEAGKAYRAELVFTTDETFDTNTTNLLQATLNGGNDVSCVGMNEYVIINYFLTIPEEDDESSEDVFSEESSEDSSSEDVADILYGDVNGDGEINSLDAAQVLKHDACLITLEGDALVAGDVNGDGVVNSLDAAQILKYDAGIIDSLK